MSSASCWTKEVVSRELEFFRVLMSYIYPTDTDLYRYLQRSILFGHYVDTMKVLSIWPQGCFFEDTTSIINLSKPAQNYLASHFSLRCQQFRNGFWCSTSIILATKVTMSQMELALFAFLVNSAVNNELHFGCLLWGPWVDFVSGSGIYGKKIFLRFWLSHSF